MTKCYNCGNEFEKVTKEHIPPRCFSDAYPEEFKKNRISVPCCDECNNLYSKIDSELRDMIAVIKDGQDGNKKFLEKGVKSILRRKVLGKDYGYNSEVGQYEISIDYEPLEQLFIKCHKGMFYSKYGFPIEELFVSQANQKMINEKHDTLLNTFFEEQHKSTPDSFLISGHQDIFRASILAYKEGANNTLEITENLDECFALSSYMIFHDRIDCLVLAVKKDTAYYELIKPALEE